MKTIGVLISIIIACTMLAVGFRLLGNTITDTPLTQNLDSPIISGVILGLLIPLWLRQKRRKDPSSTSSDN